MCYVDLNLENPLKSNPYNHQDEEFGSLVILRLYSRLPQDIHVAKKVSHGTTIASKKNKQVARACDRKECRGKNVGSGL